MSNDNNGLTCKWTFNSGEIYYITLLERASPRIYTIYEKDAKMHSGRPDFLSRHGKSTRKMAISALHFMLSTRARVHVWPQLL
jgi:hypothetical protein